MPPKHDPEQLPSTQPLNAGTTVVFTLPQLYTCAAVILAGVVAFTSAWINNANRLARLEAKLDQVNSIRWTTEDQREFANRLRHDNFGKLVVPDPDLIRRDLRTQ